MKIAVNDQRDLICAGFYSDMGTVSIKGSYFLKIDFDSKKEVSKSFKEFGMDFITQNLTERQEKRTQKKVDRGRNVELYEFDLDEIILKGDGGALLVGEQYFVREQRYRTANGTYVSNYYYYYNDIIVVNIDAEGTIEWAQKIKKQQLSINDSGFFLSYHLAVSKDKLNFIYNENVRNFTNDNPNRHYTFAGRKEGVVALTQMDINGEFKSQPLFGAKDIGALIRPKVAEQISENEVILFAQWRKKQRFAKVTFK